MYLQRVYMCTCIVRSCPSTRVRMYRYVHLLIFRRIVLILKVRGRRESRMYAYVLRHVLRSLNRERVEGAGFWFDRTFQNIIVPIGLSLFIHIAANKTTPKWSFRVGHKARPKIIHWLHILLERLVCFESSCFRH